jgi:hypothetical protein
MRCSDPRWPSAIALVVLPVTPIFVLTTVTSFAMLGAHRHDAPAWTLAPLVGVKIAFDLVVHQAWHRAEPPTSAPSSS